MATSRADIASISAVSGSAGVRRSLVIPDFLPEAEEMRTEFDDRLRDLRSTGPDRFVWDYWHMPDQYTYVRTYGDRYFRDELTTALLDRVSEWGMETLGCGSIRPPWLSYYVEGCVQELHADVPHGPWAYVFSLTRWEERGFSGGETILLRPESLDFWRNFDSGRDLEADDMVERIPTTFNQLTVFDARIPHGVRMVRGTHDPLDSRIVLHGWFESPELTTSEELQDKKSLAALNLALNGVGGRLEALDSLAGLVTVRLEFGRDGTVDAARVLSNTLVSTAGDPGAAGEAIRQIVEALGDARVSASGWAVLPFQL
jgi:hypothetical protein